MFRGGRLSRALVAKKEADEEMRLGDHGWWYSVSPAQISTDEHLLHTFMESKLDEETSSFLADSEALSNSICLQFYYSFASTLLQIFFTKTSVNGLLSRGSMFLFSRANLLPFLTIPADWISVDKNILDLGAGDGSVSAVLGQFFGSVFVTEASIPMQWRLQQRGFTLLDKDKALLDESRKFDLISCLNLLDRHPKPFELLAQLRGASLRSGCPLLLAVVLPWSQYAEFGSNGTCPEQTIRLNGDTFDTQIGSFVREVLGPAGFSVIRWTKLPYLCQGDAYRSYYVLTDAVFLLKALPFE